MKHYDSLIIISADLEESKQKEKFELFKKWITDAEGIITKDKFMGKHDMPLTFIPARQAVYFNVQFQGVNATLDNMKKKMSVDEAFIRDMTVTLDSVEGNPLAAASESTEEKVSKV